MSWEIIVTWSTLKWIMYCLTLFAYGYAGADAYFSVKENERQLTEMKDDLFYVRHMLLLNSKMIAQDLDYHSKEQVLGIIEIFEEQNKISVNDK